MADYIVVGLFITCIILTIPLITLRTVNNKKFKIICELYFERYKDLPIEAWFFYDSGVFSSFSGYGLKTTFIKHPLIYGKRSRLNHHDDEIQFFRNLDASLTTTFKYEHYISKLGCYIFIVDLIVYFLFCQT